MPAPSRKPARPAPELLAPAGSPEAFRAAVAAGADAVYLSGKRFGARKYAANFSDGEIEEAVRYAHIHGVKVYVTVNTLIHDRELSGVLEYLIWLYATGVDAVLVQDIGLAMLAREMVPGLVLHASTQMTIHNAAGVQWAAEHGFSRVVLARELAHEEVAAIADATRESGIGLEIFIHGALCYGYSGQCLLSSVLGGRSGNRGMCAQPCRKPWTLVSGTVDDYGRPAGMREVPGRDRYLLSPKDLCTYRDLPDLLQLPVASLKIEGRMKSPEYVAIVVSTYRRAIDAILAGSWEPSADAERDLLLAFNRGFTRGYLFHDRHDALMGREAPDNRGLCIGRVLRFDRAQSRAVIRLDSPVVPEPGDGLVIMHPDQPGETGFALNTVPEQRRGETLIRVPRPVAAGSLVYLTSSRKLDARVRQMLAKPAPDLLRSLPVDLNVSVSRADGTISICGSIARPDGVAVEVPFDTDLVLQPAESKPLSAEMIAHQLEKTGGTPFMVRDLTLDYDGDRFAPIAEINRIRREFFALAEDRLIASYRPPIDEVRRIQHRWQDEAVRYAGRNNGAQGAAGSRALRIGICVDTMAAVQEAAACGADRIYFEPDLAVKPKACGGEETFLTPGPVLGEALAICQGCGIPLVWKLPKITHDRYLATALTALPALASSGLAGCMIDTFSAAQAVKEVCRDAPLFGFLGLNIFNHASVTASGPSFSLVTLSPELSRDEISLLGAMLASRGSTAEYAVVVQGAGDVMVTADCTKRTGSTCAQEARMIDGSRRFFGIRDENGQIFSLHAENGCRTRIRSAQELCLIGHLPALSAVGVSEIIIDARCRPARYVRAMCRDYRKAAAQSQTGTAVTYRNALPKSLMGEIEEIAIGSLTQGHFLRRLKE
ncbi:MAG: U32 family peptidase [Methanomicrobiales archaeon]|nr:U32 family peptidase [Methanomicrobiales archaeon]